MQPVGRPGVEKGRGVETARRAPVAARSEAEGGPGRHATSASSRDSSSSGVHLELEGSMLSPRNPVPSEVCPPHTSHMIFQQRVWGPGDLSTIREPPRLFLPSSVPSPWEPGLVPVAPCLPLFPNRAFGSRDTCSSVTPVGIRSLPRPCGHTASSSHPCASKVEVVAFW